MSGNRDDISWMKQAIKEARKGLGLTSPNPPVGAVLVKNNQLLGRGWHQRAGGPHAEREAIQDALKEHSLGEISGATIYVTLEPCCTHGKTPPCTEAIIEAGIAKVVYGARDPNPNHAGRADALLEAQGIEVISGVCEERCNEIIRSFSKVQRTGLPWVVVKSAISLDGRITRPPGEGQWLSSSASRQRVQELRYQSDAIMTGGNTLRIDNPSLTVRSGDLSIKQQPWRMIVTRGSKTGLPADSKVFTDEFSNRTLVEEAGNLRAALNTLVEKGCNTVLVEAGGTLMAALLSEGFIDEVAIFYAPLLSGGPDAGFANLDKPIKLEQQEFSRIGDDILLRALVVGY